MLSLYATVPTDDASGRVIYPGDRAARSAPTVDHFHSSQEIPCFLMYNLCWGPDFGSDGEVRKGLASKKVNLGVGSYYDEEGRVRGAIAATMSQI